MTDYLIAKLRFSEEEAYYLLFNRKFYRLGRFTYTGNVIFDMFYNYESVEPECILAVMEASGNDEHRLLDYYVVKTRGGWQNIITGMVKDGLVSLDKCEEELSKTGKPYLKQGRA